MSPSMNSLIHKEKGQINDTSDINYAAIQVGTSVLGPGWRSAIWVQGCPFHCQGCIAPDWIPFKKNQSISIDQAAEQLLSDPRVNGLTFSGGEPMMQAEALARLSRKAKKIRKVNIICYSGFTLDRLKTSNRIPGVDDLLNEIDVLIDGPFIQSLNDNKGLRGSSNQCIHYLTDQLREYDFSQSPRKIEIYIHPDYALFVGIPPKEFALGYDHILTSQTSSESMGVSHERP
jgi:anaerobic ribonucleoside-triphosphate reductase activating protein